MSVVRYRIRVFSWYSIFFFSSHTSTFQLPDKPWSQVSSLPPSPVLAVNFYRAYGSAIPLFVDYSSSVANSRSHAFRKSICAQEKVPTRTYTIMQFGGLELTKLTGVPGSRIT